LQVPNRSNDVPRGKIAFGIVVAPNNQDSWVMATSFHEKIVKIMEVAIISGKDNPILLDGIGQLNDIGLPLQPRINGALNIVASVAQVLGQYMSREILIKE
jgi:hypothetical protein